MWRRLTLISRKWIILKFYIIEQLFIWLFTNREQFSNSLGKLGRISLPCLPLVFSVKILLGGNQEQLPANVCWVPSILLVPTSGLQDTEEQSLCWAWNENHNQSQNVPVRAQGCIPSATGESEQLRGNSKTHLRGFLWGHANWPSGHPRQNQCQKQSHHPTQFYEPVYRTGVSYRSIGEGLLGGAWATTAPKSRSLSQQHPLTAHIPSKGSFSPSPSNC